MRVRRPIKGVEILRFGNTDYSVWLKVGEPNWENSADGECVLCFQGECVLCFQHKKAGRRTWATVYDADLTEYPAWEIPALKSINHLMRHIPDKTLQLATLRALVQKHLTETTNQKESIHDDTRKVH